ncbi:MAG TPA: methylated-DNA--[protein]-cysteine S-methyltransferase [Acidimicrobiales bacterium]
MDIAAIETPLGYLELSVADDHLNAVDVVDTPTVAPLGRHAPGPARVAALLRAYFDGDLGAIDEIPVRPLIGTSFMRDVWAALRSVPAGETCSYRELAEMVGRPTAFRAVGQANGRNPTGIVVPCHRVIASDGRLGGYTGGLDRKRWLLAHEGAQVNGETFV